MNKNLKNIKFITRISVLAVSGFILMFFAFPLPFAPTFYEVDFSIIPSLIGAFAFGTFSGVLIELIKIILKLLFIPTSSFFIGEFSLFVLNVSCIVVASILYHRFKTHKGAIIALISGALTFILFSVLLNYYVLIPLYVSVLGFPLENIINLAKAINPNVTSLTTLIIYATLPFNIVKIVLNILIIKLIYKKISVFLKY